jgi:hypothetical protein
MSSARFKRDVRDMDDQSGAVRPVSFRYDNDPANTLQYGLQRKWRRSIRSRWSTARRQMTVRPR